MPYQLSFSALSHEDKLKKIDPKNANSPFSKFIGNQQAIIQLGLAAYAALGKNNHCCNEHNFALLGPASVGKTTLAKLFAKVVQLPFCEIHPKSVNSINDILGEIADVCANTYTKAIVDGQEKFVSLGLEPVREVGTAGHGGKYLIAPPMIVFIDEVHDLKNSLVQGLLKATEPNDRIMYSEAGYILNTANICWIIATTDRGVLFDAFDTRFTKIVLRPYTKSEVAKIIKIKFDYLEEEVCNLISSYSGNVPREALDFAHDVKLMKELKQSEDWAQIVLDVAEMRGIDKFGLTRQRLNILISLGQQGPISLKRLSYIAECKTEELEKYILPPMLVQTPDSPSLITVSPRGYTITQAGLAELDKRKIKHLGLEAVPENMRSWFFKRFGNQDATGSN